MNKLQNIIDRKTSLIEAKQQALLEKNTWLAERIQEEIEELEVILRDNG